ncbi:hypothetical protein SLS55_006970 [Diplodia seriata]|uniref:Uncharacterized protein n=1 Tax=Diplodia seriata TaxID=420778 RepID=A0ABR3CCB1_9PEZI
MVMTLITTFTCSTHTNGTMTSTTSSEDSSTNPLLSRNLRTYWATTIPLTVLLLLSWLIWRHRATRLFESDYAAIQRGEDAVMAGPARPPPPQQPSSPPAVSVTLPATVAASKGVGSSSSGGGSKERSARVATTEVIDLEDGRVRERGGHHGRGARSRVSALLMPSSLTAGNRNSNRRSSSMSTWPTGPSGVSAPEMVGTGTAVTAVGRRGKGKDWEDL